MGANDTRRLGERNAGANDKSWGRRRCFGERHGVDDAIGALPQQKMPRLYTSQGSNEVRGRVREGAGGCGPW